MGPETSWPAVPPGVLDEVVRMTSSVLSGEELDRVRVGWASEGGLSSWGGLHPVAGEGETVLLAEVVACGEQFLCPLWQPGVADVALDGFADQLEDFMAESRFAWGQQRHVPRR